MVRVKLLSAFGQGLAVTIACSPNEREITGVTRGIDIVRRLVSARWMASDEEIMKSNDSTKISTVKRAKKSFQTKVTY